MKKYTLEYLAKNFDAIETTFKTVKTGKVSSFVNTADGEQRRVFFTSVTPNPTATAKKSISANDMGNNKSCHVALGCMAP